MIDILLPVALPVLLILLLLSAAPVMANVVEEQRILPDLLIVEDCDTVVNDNPCDAGSGRAVTTAEPDAIVVDLATTVIAVDDETD